MLQRIAACCNVLWFASATPRFDRNTLQYTAKHCNTLHHTAVRYSVLQCIAVCCNVLQCVALCYSFLPPTPSSQTSPGKIQHPRFMRVRAFAQKKCRVLDLFVLSKYLEVSGIICDRACAQKKSIVLDSFVFIYVCVHLCLCV